MLILGTKPAQHDACFALVRDGEPVFVYEQERFNRVKHGMSSHLSVLFDALDEHGVAPADIDLVTNCIDPARLPERKAQAARYLHGAALDATNRYLDWRLPTWRRVLLAAGFPGERVVDVRHHLCHAAGAYYASPYDDAAILSVDGSGETETAMLAHGTGTQISVLRTTPHPHSLGHLYQAATFWLGWGFGEEGKTMALAGYGDPARCRARLDEFVRVDEDGDFAFRPAGTRGSSRYTSAELAADVFTRLFGPGRAAGQPVTSLHRDVAAAVQGVCDDIMLRSARFLRAATGAGTLLLTGGVALNSVSNGLVARSGVFDRAVAYPQANDSGTALGGALYGYHRLAGRERRRRWHMAHAYWGRRVDVENAERAAAEYGVSGARVPDPARQVAELLAAGKVVGWVQGRAEVGPRALGNRSILGDPRAPGIKERINAGVKHREDWRPFAPSVLREDVGEYFEADGDLPYMTTVVPVRAGWRQTLSSVCHVDGTARVQTVTAESNPRFHALLRAVKARTGMGMVLNTSFNDRGEPLVQTCRQAVRLFRRSEMDALCIGDWLFTGKTPGVEAPPFSAVESNVGKLPCSRLLLVCDRLPASRAALAVRLADENPRLRMTGGSDDLLAALPDRLRLRVVPLPALDPAVLAASYDGVVFYPGRSGDEFLFDRALYHSELAGTSRRLLEDGPLAVFWIDVHGDVTPMCDVLYVHHDGPPIPQTSYARHWARPVGSRAAAR
ncbi:MAG: carbamoyltransferase [Mycobacteriales bacterium]